MQKDSVYTDKILDEKARRLFANERRIKRLDGWFLIREISEEYESAHPFIPAALRKARALLRVCERIPLSLDENAVFAGTQRDAFAKSYALINPNFKVSTFNGYCDLPRYFATSSRTRNLPRSASTRYAAYRNGANTSDG